MDPISLSGAYEGLKAAKALLGVALDAKVESESKTRILEAQAKLGDVQDTLFELRERLSALQVERDNLRAELSAEREWATKSAQYQLSQTEGAAVVYQFVGEPAHFACPSCFNKREVHILQPASSWHGTFKCTGCGSSFPVSPPSRGSS
jgi:regulator of replication initiation timing